ncbi:LTA synthase family protein [Limosilactobacillus caecicola]|uniref:LTA synthase family protein n=1 Tax=Limosilactobacillus caecicola TaxID=2941332 RepID=UPI00203FE431|nr:LTA synthase family protein [Limosilactobacillus caecicola]
MQTKKSSPIIFNLAMGLLVLNLWLWNAQLPFANYALNNHKIMLIQVVHVLLNVATSFVFLKLGQQFLHERPRRLNLVNTWLEVIGLGLAETLIYLLWKAQFQFTTLFNAFFPLTRNVVPMVMAIILGRYFIPYLANLPSGTRHRIGGGLLLALGASFIFNSDLWGFGTTYSLLLTLVILTLGATLSDLDGTALVKHPKFILGGVLLLNLVLAGVMPKISMTYHNDFSTVARFASPANVLTILVALGIVLLFAQVELHLHFNAVFLTLLLASYPILQDQFIASVNGHLHRGLYKYPFMVVAAALLLVVAKGCAIVMHKFTQTAWYQRYAQRLVVIEEPHGLHQLWTEFWRAHHQDCWAFLFTYGLSLVSFFAMDDGLTITPNMQSYNTLIYIFCNKQSIILLTTVFIWLMFKFFQALTNRFWWGIGITTIVNVVWIVANRIKIGARNEPIMPSEMVMYQAYGSLLKMVSPWLLGGAVVLIILACLLIWHWNRKYPTAKLSVPRRITYLAIAVLAFGSSAFWNHENSPIQAFMEGMGDESYPYNQLSGARVNGPLIQFMDNLDVTVMDKPAGYSKATMAKIAKKYQLTAKQINKTRHNQLNKQTIILNLSESYSNPTRVPGVTLKNNPMPFVQSMEKKSTSGVMISSGYGGGTANMEYMSLTGLALANFAPTLVTPYTQLVTFQTKPWSINQLFKQSTVIHPYVGTFYSRETVYKKFGFDKFMHLGSKYKIKHQKKIDRSPYLSDYTSYANVLDQLKSYQKPQFISLVTMQNHFPYTEHYYNGSAKYQAKIKGASTNPDTVAQYATGLHYTDLAMKQFIRQINQSKQPITLVFYGDHLPGIYENDMSKDGLKLHETDYFIYSNPAARRQGAKKSIGHSSVVAPNDFIAMMAEQTNSKVTPYLALLTKVYQDLPAVSLKTNNTSANSYHSSPQFVNAKGKIVSSKHFTKAQKQLWHDYQLVQYDMTSGHNYLKKQLFFNFTK